MVPADRLSWGSKWQRVPGTACLLLTIPTLRAQGLGCQGFPCRKTQEPHHPLADVAPLVSCCRRPGQLPTH